MSHDDEDFQPARAGELTDLSLLPGRFDAFAAEVRSSFEMLGNKILPALDRFTHAIADLASRVSKLEMNGHALSDRLSALEAVRKPKKRKARK